MTTRIDVNLSNSELSSSTANQVAINRQQQLNKEEARRIQEEGLRRRRANQRIADARNFIKRVIPLREELTASAKVTSNIGHFWISRKSEPVTNIGVWAGVRANVGNRVYADVELFIGFKRTTKIYCGNGSSYVEIAHGVPDPERQMVPVYDGFPPVTDPPLKTKASLSARRLDGLQPSFFNDYDYNNEVKIFAFPAGEDRTIVFFFENYSTAIMNADVPVFGITRYDFPFDGDVSALCGAPTSGPRYTPNPSNPYSGLAEIISPEIEVQYKSIRRCFICGNTSIREIDSPQEMESVLDFMQPRPEFQVKTLDSLIITGGIFLTQYIAKAELPVFEFRSIPELSPNDDIFFPPTFSGALTPIIYSAIVQEGRFGTIPEDVSTYWQSLIGSLVNGPNLYTRAIVEDESGGLYATTDAMSSVASFNSDEPFIYGRWYEPGVAPEYTILAIPELDYEFPVYNPTKYEQNINKPFKMSSSRTPVQEEYTGYQFYLVKVWDWDRPNYCYTICKGLGFSDQDLVP